MSNFNPQNLINWNELSRLLVGDRSSLQRNKIAKVHRSDVNRLIELIGQWENEIQSRNK